MECDLIVKIMSVKEYLHTLTGAVNSKAKVLAWFQELCGRLTHLLLEITEYIRQIKPIENAAKEMMLLYLLQLNTALSILIKIFMTENEAYITITEARYCIIKQICMCLDGLEEVLTQSYTADPTINGFVKFMDLALDKITEIEVEKGSPEALNVCTEVRNIVEEVLCHGMSIAQVALKEDCNCIKGGSKEVLHCLDSLYQQIDKPEPNIAMCNLFVDSCCDKLCSLERKVNTAVLKLSLKVFSECTKPLEDLHHFCLSKDRNTEILDELVADFDMHVDRMIQVGLFAVACSSNNNCTLKMRSCLASLEALEGELVPALTAMYLDPTPHNLYFASVLKYYWIKQALALKKYIYLIIDPFAFCQVTYEVIKDINEELEEKFKVAMHVDKNLVKPITLQTKILYEMLAVSIKDSPPENQEIIKKYLNDVINVTTEIDAAAERLLREEEICKENIFRVFKRCKIQENILRKLLSTLREDVNDKVETVELSRRCEENSYSNNEVMDQIMVRGKQILKDRSVLYKTPVKSSPNYTRILKNKDKPLPLSRLVHIRNMQFSHMKNGSDANTIDLQITDTTSLKYNLHMDIPPKMFQCTKCGASFTRSDALNRHGDCSGGAKTEIQCPECSYTSTRRDAVVRHLRSKHGHTTESASSTIPKCVQPRQHQDEQRPSEEATGPSRAPLKRPANAAPASVPPTKRTKPTPQPSRWDACQEEFATPQSSLGTLGPNGTCRSSPQMRD